MDDAQDLAEKYKKELVVVQEKFDKINNYINDSRYTTIKKDAEHVEFVNSEMTRKEDIENARASQTQMVYSELQSDITDLKESLTNQKNFAIGTVRMLEDKLV